MLGLQGFLGGGGYICFVCVDVSVVGQLNSDGILCWVEVWLVALFGQVGVRGTKVSNGYKSVII